MNALPEVTGVQKVQVTETSPVRLQSGLLHREECPADQPAEPTDPSSGDDSGSTTPIQTYSEIGERLACHIIAEDFTVFDLHDLDKEDGSPSSEREVNWKFCQYIAG